MCRFAGSFAYLLFHILPNFFLSFLPSSHKYLNILSLLGSMLIAVNTEVNETRSLLPFGITSSEVNRDLTLQFGGLRPLVQMQHLRPSSM